MRAASTPVKAPARLECQREDGVEVDRGADLSELKCALRLGARLLEGGCEVAVQPFGARERFTQELLDGGVGASPSAHDHEQGDDGRDEGEARRADGYTDGNPRSAVAEKHLHPAPIGLLRRPRPG